MVKNMIRLIIAGSRNFNDYETLKSVCDRAIEHIDVQIKIISGTARGADQLGERYATERNFPLKKFPANWEEHGKKAGYLRNLEMARYASHAIIFWDGQSKGTESMIRLAETYNLDYRVFKV
jgi:hypothetical protein